MSVVNRMLQDIDRRLATPGIEALTSCPDIRSVASMRSPPPARSRRARWGAAVLLLMLGIAACLWLGERALDRGSGLFSALRDGGAPRAAQVAIRPSASAPAPSSSPRAAQTEQQKFAQMPPAAQASTQGGEPLPNVSLKLSALLAEIPPEPDRASPPRTARIAAVERLPAPRSATNAQGAAPSQADGMAPAARTTPAPKLASNAPRPSTAPQTLEGPRQPQASRILQAGAPAIAATNAPVRRMAPEETIAAARSLWSDGAHEAAVATLREALADARSPGDAPAAHELVRELARFEIADDRVQAALDLLKGRQAGLRDDADAWALRGNAEQRLALHADAAASYLTALRLRPGEGRWMLGAAISLAAQGRRDEAQAWVDRARATGAITPAISMYLRQLGLDAQ